MRPCKVVACSVLVGTLLGGCSSLNTTQKNAIGGGILGAGAGALIGHQTHHAAGGAAIGGALGALAGTAVGYQQQQQEERSASLQSQINRQRSEIRKLKQQQAAQNKKASEEYERY
jgi:uncharacterized protein YcfJ